jgi:hypothetical protein
VVVETDTPRMPQASCGGFALSVNVTRSPAMGRPVPVDRTVTVKVEVFVPLAGTVDGESVIATAFGVEV